MTAAVSWKIFRRRLLFVKLVLTGIKIAGRDWKGEEKKGRKGYREGTAWGRNGNIVCLWYLKFLDDGF